MDNHPSPTFPLSPVPANPLGEGSYVKTAGICIIGDEILNGKTRDSNSNFAAKLLFDLGIELRRIEVIPDDEDEIVEMARTMVAKYDLVLISGGIGPTHDDITYASLAKAFDPKGELVHHDETLHRMSEMGKRRWDLSKQTEEQKTARMRMALFPVQGSEVLFVQEDLWVPVVRLQGKLCILPGIPRLFERLVEGLLSRYVSIPPSTSKPYRHLIHTKMPESSIAPFLTKLADRVKPEGIRVGSYPHFGVGVDVSLIGHDQSRLQELGKEVCEELKGEAIKQGRLGDETPAAPAGQHPVGVE